MSTKPKFAAIMLFTVCQTTAALFNVQNPTKDTCFAPTMNTPEHEQQPDQTAIWTMIQSQKSAAIDSLPAYVHPLVRRSSSLMSNSSLETCTESLGSETGSGDFPDDDQGWLDSSSDDDQVVVRRGLQNRQRKPEVGNQLTNVNYHSAASRKSVPRSFPPPLPSISLHDGTSIQMTTCRQGGRLVVKAVKAVPVASQNYLHARRQDGRLLLSFVDATTAHQASSAHSAEDDNESAENTIEELEDLEEEEMLAEQVAAPLAPAKEMNQYDGEAKDEDDEEEVEVVDRGTMVEVKVCSQPGGATKVFRSSPVINKFVGGAPLTNQNRWAEPHEDINHSVIPVASQACPPRQRPFASTTTTAAAAAVAASSATASSEMVGQYPSDNKLLFTSKRRNREEMLHHMRRCSELRRPLVFWEAGCIPTSS